MPIPICNAFTSGCFLDWNGVAAVATAAATLTALWIPLRAERNERRKRSTERREIAHEACSMVDRIVAYYEMTEGLIAVPLIYAPQLQSCERIFENVRFYKRGLAVLIARPELSDGTVLAASAAEIVADCIIETLPDPHGLTDAEWGRRRSRLHKASLSAQIAKERSRSVRSYYGIAKSQTAQQIVEKYSAVIAACAIAQATNAAPVVADLAATPY